MLEASDVLLLFPTGMCWQKAMCLWNVLEDSDVLLLFPTWSVYEASDVLLLFPTWNVLEASDVLLTVCYFLPEMCWTQAMCFCCFLFPT